MTKIELYRQFSKEFGEENTVKYPKKYACRTKIKSISDFEKALKIAETYYKEKEYVDNFRLVFRGQKYDRWNITASMSRKREYKEYEREFLYEYRKKKMVLDKKEDLGELCINDVFLAQHYGFPTRLIDVTTDYRVSLWFASEFFGKDNGEIFIIPAKIVDENDPFIKYNLWQIENYEKIKQYEMGKIVNEYESKSGYHIVLPEEEYTLPLKAVKSTCDNGRVKNQHAYGLMAPLHTVKVGKEIRSHILSRRFPNDIISIRIDAKYKEAIRKELDSKSNGINEAFLFPDDMEHFSHYIVNKYMQKD